MEAPQNEQNNAHDHEPPRASSFRIRLFRVVEIMLVAYVVFIGLYNPVSEPFSEILCQLPVLSGYYPGCVHELGYPKKPTVDPDFITLARLQSRLGYVLEDSASSPVIADNIKGSVMDLRDLIVQVQLSSLVRKNILVRELKLFVEDAMVASRSLQGLSGQIWGVVDRIISFNDHMLIALDIPKRPFGGAVDFLLPFGRETGEMHRMETKNIWLQAIRLLETNLAGLIHEVEANIDLLERLEERLNIIHDMVITEEKTQRDQEEESNRQWFPDQEKRKSCSTNLGLLLTVGDRRKLALNQVTGVLVKLKQMSNELGDLRERMATPSISVGLSSIPIEAHIKSIQSGTERLVHGQSRAREMEDAYRQKKFCSGYSA